MREALEQLIAGAPGRVLVTTFASNIGRLREVVRSAHKLGRTSAIIGRSMEENLRVARELGFLNVPEGSIVDVREVNELPPEKVVLLSTGSQGEPTSVLSRMARGDHPLVRIQPGDTVIFSASPVPGNEESVARAIDNLFRRGARVVYQMIDPRIHVSGHASREELKHLLELLKPTLPGAAARRAPHAVAVSRAGRRVGHAARQRLSDRDRRRRGVWRRTARRARSRSRRGRCWSMG